VKGLFRYADGTARVTCLMVESARQIHTSHQQDAVKAEENIEKLLRHSPSSIATCVRRLRRPQARWVRIPVALLLIFGGVFSFLPVLGLWMMPLGFLLLAVDIPFLRRLLYRFINWLAARKPQWFR